MQWSKAELFLRAKRDWARFLISVISRIKKFKLKNLSLILKETRAANSRQKNARDAFQNLRSKKAEKFCFSLYVGD